eukprot:2219115-Amphidinium_carterae.2
MYVPLYRTAIGAGRGIDRELRTRTDTRISSPTQEFIGYQCQGPLPSAKDLGAYMSVGTTKSPWNNLRLVRGSSAACHCLLRCSFRHDFAASTSASGDPIQLSCTGPGALAKWSPTHFMTSWCWILLWPLACVVFILCGPNCTVVCASSK